MKKAFIFDLDGVITDTAEFHYLAWKDLADSLDIQIDREFNETLKGISRTDSLNNILAHGNHPALSEDEKEALAASKNTAYLKLLEELTPASILPGVLEFLKAAKNENILCGIASASKNAPFILEKLGLLDYFDYIVDPATLKNGKPDPEIFLNAAAKFSVSPSEAIGFEDAQSGVNAIKDAGMYAIGIDAHQQLQGADQIVATLNELNVTELINL